MERALLAAGAVATALLCLMMTASQAQTQTRSATVYRCGPDGRELRDAPCSADPSASRASVGYDEPTSAQRDAAAKRARTEGRSADVLEAARLKREADERKHAPGAIAINGRGLPPAPAASTAKAGDKQHPKPPKAPSPPKAPRAPKAPQAPSLPTSKPA